MRYSTFEQAAVEASAGVNAIDAEIQRLKVKRDLLATIAQQLSAILPAIAEAFPESEGGQAPAMPEHAAGEHAASANGTGDSWSSSMQQEGDPSPAYSAAPSSGDAAQGQEAPATREPSFADLLAQSKTFSLRNEGWPNSSAVDQRGLRQLL